MRMEQIVRWLGFLALLGGVARIGMAPSESAADHDGSWGRI